MDASKQQYLTAVRANTAYPTYRATIGAISVLGYLLAAVTVLGGVVSALAAGRGAGSGGFIVTLAGSLLVAGIVFLLARLWKEASLVLVDMGDAIIDQGAQAAAPPQRLSA